MTKWERYQQFRWERYQQSRKRKDNERSQNLLYTINLVQRASETPKTASQIVIALPGAWKRTAWQGVKKYLMRGEGC